MKNDEQLQNLLAEFRNVSPTPDQIAKWKMKAEQKSLNKNIVRIHPWVQLVAAVFVGFVIGALFFNQPTKSSSDVADYEDQNATIEYVFNNSN